MIIDTNKLIPFIEADSRKNRNNSPLTIETVVNRHNAYFKDVDLLDKSVLDIGSCFGITAEILFQNGIKSYTGIEIQDTAIQKSSELLKEYKDKVNIKKIDTRELLTYFKENSFDIVIAAGVIYTTIDIIKLINDICIVSKDVVIFDTLHLGVIHDDSTGLILINPKQQMNYANDSKGFIGIGSRINPVGLESVLTLNGFKDIKLITPEISKNCQDAYNVLIKRPGPKSPMRFIMQARKNVLLNIKQELSDLVITKNEESLIPYSPALPKWEFNETIAGRFQEEAFAHIPDYQRVIDLSIEVCKEFLDKNAKIIDVGSALGHTIKCLNDKGFVNVCGVECSESMINNSYNSINIIKSKEFPDYQNYDAILCNWTLHFVKTLEERKNYLHSMINSLNDNGILILTEKTKQSEKIQKLYYDFKKSNGITDEVIQLKKQLLKGVLNEFECGWYLKQLYDFGFKPEIINARLGFITFLCHKKS